MPHPAEADIRPALRAEQAQEGRAYARAGLLHRCREELEILFHKVYFFLGAPSDRQRCTRRAAPDQNWCEWRAGRLCNPPLEHKLPHGEKGEASGVIQVHMG